MLSTSRRSHTQLAALWILTSRFWLLLLCSVSQSAFAAPAACQVVHPIVEGDSLVELSGSSFGNAYYAPAILLATNARSSEKGYRFISDPNNLPVGGNACIPTLAEADTLRSRYDSYLAAVYDMVLPTPADVSDALVAIDPRSPARLVTWMRTDQVEALKDVQGNWLKQALADIWVVPATNLKSFCEEFQKSHPHNPDLLTLRLEQRLGLPPAANKSLFVEIEIEDPSASRNLFRPCVDPTVTSTTCTLGPPPAGVAVEHQNWMFQQYYNSFALARPLQHPWTSLGYTFDWAPAETGGSHFVKVGETEFVIPPGAAIEIQSATPTTEYCSAH